MPLLIRCRSRMAGPAVGASVDAHQIEFVAGKYHRMNLHLLPEGAFAAALSAAFRVETRVPFSIGRA